MIVYGLLAEVSIGQLYIAGIVPGILMMIAFMFVILAIALIAPEKAPRVTDRKAFAASRMQAVLSIAPTIALMVLVLGTIYLGIATATEAAAFGACGAFVVALLKRRVSASMLREAFSATAATTGMIMLILVGAFLLQFVLSLTGIPVALSKWTVSLGLTEVQLIFLICLIYLVLGMFLESLAMVVMTIPIIVPVLNAMGVDLVWFGIVVTIMVELSLVTPPVGMNLFVMQSVRGRTESGSRPRPIGDIYVGVLPFVAVMLIVVVAIVVWPNIALYLVSAMK